VLNATAGKPFIAVRSRPNGVAGVTRVLFQGDIPQGVHYNYSGKGVKRNLLRTAVHQNGEERG
jgi:hypothetical protein